jgi:CheY-like chemotaxis protein
MLFSSHFGHANQPSRRRSPGAAPSPVVLLIGDARPRTTYRAILSQGSFEIFDADGADEGIALARTLRPSLIMVELSMQLRDGWEVNRLLKADPATYLIPVVATSLAKLPGGTYHRARSAGFVDLVTRPLERRHVLEVVGTWARPPAQVVV